MKESEIKLINAVIYDSNSLYLIGEFGLKYETLPPVNYKLNNSVIRIIEPRFCYKVEINLENVESKNGRHTATGDLYIDEELRREDIDLIIEDCNPFDKSNPNKYQKLTFCGIANIKEFINSEIKSQQPTPTEEKMPYDPDEELSARDVRIKILEERLAFLKQKLNQLESRDGHSLSVMVNAGTSILKPYSGRSKNNSDPRANNSVTPRTNNNFVL